MPHVTAAKRWNEGGWPPHATREWSVWDGQRPVAASSLAEVRTLLRRSRGMALVGAPGASHYVPAPLVPELPAQLAEQAARQTWVSGGILFGLSLVAIVLAGLANFLAFVPYLLLNVLLALVMMRDARACRAEPRRAAERIRFLFWLRRSPTGRRNIGACAGAVVVLSSIQLCAVHSAAGLDGWLLRAGGLHGAVAGGDVWRLATAPWLHLGWEHHLTNCVLLLMIGPVALGMHRMGAASTFVLAAIGGVAAQVGLFLHLEGITAGMSGGIVGLAGFLWALGAARTIAVPAGVPTFAALVAFLIIIIPISLRMPSAVFAHVCGFLIGVLGAACVSGGEALRRRVGGGTERRGVPHQEGVSM